MKKATILPLEFFETEKTLGWEHWSSGYGRWLMFNKVVGSNPATVYWMDMTFFHIDLL